MHCPKCGGEIENGAAFCSNCGLDLRGKPAAGPAVQMSDAMPPAWGQAGAAAPPKPRKSRKKAWIIAASALVVVAAAAVGAYFIFSGGGAKLEGRYCNINGYANDFFEFTPDQGNPGHGAYRSESEVLSVSGKYDMAPGNAVIIRNYLGKDETKFDIKGDYLVPEYSIFEGEIPEGETFDVTCEQSADGWTTTISFEKGGAYTETTRMPAGNVVISGTYRREDDKVLMESEQKNGVVSKQCYLVYRGQLASEAYVKQEA